jgi:hypothetical protein
MGRFIIAKNGKGMERRKALYNHAYHKKKKSTVSPVAVGCVNIVAVVAYLAWTSLEPRDGGWLPFAEAEALLDDGQCGIPKLASMTKEQFDSEYSLQKPFILTEVTSNTQAHFTKRILQDRTTYGSNTVRIGIARDIIKNYGSGYSPRNLADFIESLPNSRNDKKRIGGDSEYAFDRVSDNGPSSVLNLPFC